MSPTGLVPVMRRAKEAGPRNLPDQWLDVSTDKDANGDLRSPPSSPVWLQPPQYLRHMVAELRRDEECLQGF